MFKRLNYTPLGGVARGAASRRDRKWDLLGAIGDAPLAEVVGADLDGDLVSSEDADVIFAHSPRDVGGDDMPILQLYPKGGIGQCLDDAPFHLDELFFCHRPCGLSLIPGRL